MRIKLINTKMRNIDAKHLWLVINHSKRPNKNIYGNEMKKFEVVNSGKMHLMMKVPLMVFGLSTTSK